jgi:hypothetical protein
MWLSKWLAVSTFVVERVVVSNDGNFDANSCSVSAALPMLRILAPELGTVTGVSASFKMQQVEPVKHCCPDILRIRNAARKIAITWEVQFQHVIQQWPASGPAFQRKR